MGLLDRLKPQPRWKHADPAVRAAAALECGPDDLDALTALVRDDPDARVRRTAVGRVTDAGLLAEVVRTDPDDDVKAEAVRNLAGLAAEATDVDTAGALIRALGDLGRTRELGSIARHAYLVAGRLLAVDLLDDQKALASVSRHAEDPATRLHAFERVTDAGEILNVAAKAEYTDIALAALERLQDVEAVTAVAQRARSKVAARKARARLRAIEEAARPVAPAPEVPMSPEDRQRGQDIVARVEAVVSIADLDAAEADLAAARLAWAELEADTHVEAALGFAYETACEAAREAIAERQQERRAAQERAATMAREQADRVAICDEIEQLDGEESADRVAELRVRWDNLPPIPAEFAVSLTRRFQDVSRAYEARARRRTLAAAARVRLETLAGELETLAAPDRPVEESVARWRGLRRDAEMLQEFSDANPEAAARLAAAVTVLEGREQELQERRSKQEQDNLRRLQQICRHVESVAEAEALTLKAGDKALREIRDVLEQKLPLPTKKDRQDLVARLEAARTKLGPRVQELRDADDWQRFANVQVQEELCAAMEALKESTDLDAAARKMRELQAKWKSSAAAPRGQGEALWRRFKAAQDAVYVRSQEHFAAQAVQRTETLARKLALIERVEALADSTDWVKTAVEIQKLQAEWKALGAVPRGQEKATWERFRAACDRFFSRRQEDLKHKKDEWAGNLAKKEALCAQAEALADSTDWEVAAAAIKKLQAEWKATGPVRKAKSEVVWNRFRGACDRFFDRFKHRDQLDVQGHIQEREAIVREVEGLVPADAASPGEAPEGLYATIQTARARWQQSGEVPRSLLGELGNRFTAALNAAVGAWPQAFTGTELDPEVTRGRMEKLVARVEKLLSEQVPARPAANLSPAERLAQQWRDRLASNTIAGGGAGPREDAKWKAAEQDVRSAQQQWQRLGPVPATVAAEMTARFEAACRRFFDQRKRAS